MNKKQKKEQEAEQEAECKAKTCPFCTQKSLEPIRLEANCPLILQCLSCGERVTKELTTEDTYRSWGKPKRKKINN